MNKKDLVEIVSKKVDSTKKDAEKFVSATLDAILETVGNQEPVKIVGFGNWEIKRRARKTGRNPQTGESIEIPAKTAVVFKPSKLMREAVNGIMVVEG